MIPMPPENIFVPSDDLQFSEPDHRYWCMEHPDQELTSVTTLIKQYSEPFDADYHSERIAERDGVNAQELRDKWTLNASEASTKGTYVHEQIENICHKMCYHEIVIPTDGPYPNMMQGVAKFFANNISLASDWVLPEHRVWWPEYALAGTIDLVASRFRGVPALIDWKTNKSMDITGYRNMQPPFQRGKLKLPDANLFHYFLQLNMYRRIMAERYDFNAELMVIVHLSGTSYFEYEASFMDAHIDKILERRKAELDEIANGNQDRGEQGHCCQPDR